MSNVRVINGPHLRTERTTRQVMMYVTLSLIPALFGAVYFFGIRALYLAGLSVTICVITEYLWQKLTKKQVTAGDFSAVVTGLLIVYNMPVTVPVWALAAADVFAIIFVKQMFGGIGNNFVNPALMGRLLIMIVWPQAVMQYVVPNTINPDAVSGATVLGTVKGGAEAGYSYLQMFLGETPGAMGETSKLLLLVGFGFLCYKGIVNAEAAVTYISTVVLLTFVFGHFRTVYRRHSSEFFRRRSHYGWLLYADRLCLCFQKGKTSLCSDSRRDYGGNPNFQQLSGGNLLRYFNSKLYGRSSVHDL